MLPTVTASPAIMSWVYIAIAVLWARRRASPALSVPTAPKRFAAR